MKILVVDDEDVVRRAISDMLRISGHEVESTGCAEEGAAMAEKGAYDFLIVDYRMPGKGGAWLLANTKLPDSTKVLMLTAFATGEIVDQMKDLGVAAHLTKPISFRDLEAALQAHASTD